MPYKRKLKPECKEQECQMVLHIGNKTDKFVQIQEKLESACIKHFKLVGSENLLVELEALRGKGVLIQVYLRFILVHYYTLYMKRKKLSYQVLPIIKGYKETEGSMNIFLTIVLHAAIGVTIEDLVRYLNKKLLEALKELMKDADK